MEPYKETFQIKTTETISVVSKLRHYLTGYDFIEQQADDRHLVFVKKFSFFQGWQFNPLNWESQLDIDLEEGHGVKIMYQVEGNGFLTPHGFTGLFRGFIEYLGSYLLHDVDYRAGNQKLIKKANNKVLTALAYVLGGTAISTFIAISLNEITDLKFLGYVGLFGGTYLALQIVNRWLFNINQEVTDSGML